jgi:uncharacterized protein
MIEERKLKVLDANILYLLGAILFFTVGYYVQTRDLKWGLLITQYILVLLPPVLYLLAKKINIKKALKLNKISVKHGFLAACITLLMYPTAVFANSLFMAVMSLLGNLNIPELPAASDLKEFAVLIFVISISAGICEEVFFRGFMLSGYENLGSGKAIIISAVLFGFFHFNLYNLFGPIVLGLVFGYLVMLTNSIYAGIIGHIINNGFALSLSFLLSKAAERLEEINPSQMEMSTSFQLFISVVFFGILAFITGFCAYYLINIIKKDMERMKEETIEEEELEKTTNRWEYMPLLLVVPLFLLIAIMQIKEIITLG